MNCVCEWISAKCGGVTDVPIGTMEGEGEGCGGSDVTVAKQHEKHLCDSMVGVE